MSTSIYIDALLEQYLDLLHQYTTLRHELNNVQASVYQHISRANFAAERGIRYGRDFYDERMQASTTLEISTSSSDQLHLFSVIQQSTRHPVQPGEDARSNGTVQEGLEHTNFRQGEDTTTDSAETEEGNDKTPLEHLDGVEAENNETLQKGIEDLNVQPEDGPANDENGPLADEKEEKSAEDSRRETRPPKTPLSWFGILNPGAQSLRAAQAASTSMLTTIIPQIVSVDRGMKELEIRIRRARKFRAKADAEIMKQETNLARGTDTVTS